MLIILLSILYNFDKLDHKSNILKVYIAILKISLKNNNTTITTRKVDNYESCLRLKKLEKYRYCWFHQWKKFCLRSIPVFKRISRYSQIIAKVSIDTISSTIEAILTAQSKVCCYSPKRRARVRFSAGSAFFINLSSQILRCRCTVCLKKISARHQVVYWPWS